MPLCNLQKNGLKSTQITRFIVRTVIEKWPEYPFDTLIINGVPAVSLAGILTIAY